MRYTAKLLSAGAFALLLAIGSLVGPVALHAQAQQNTSPQQGGASTQAPSPTFRVTVDLVTTDVIVRDQKSAQFIADLKPGEFEIYEDGVKQDIASLTLVHGGRSYDQITPPPAPVQEGIILPRNRPTNDTAGRIFLLFIDDLHLDFGQTPRTRQILEKMLKSLIHEGDMFGIVTTGTSSISQQLTYDRQVLESAIKKVTGNGLKPKEIIQGGQGSNGPTELRHRAQVAFSTAYDLMRNLEKVQNRRKAVLYISSGYDFNPFEKSRLDEQAERFQTNAEDLQNDPFFRQQQSSQALAEADLVHEMAELTRAANRANATLYTIDPRGLVAGQDVNQNDFDKALKRIDAETSDYYVLGYYSKNPDPLRRVRKIEVKVSRDGLNVWSRTSYALKPTPSTN
jgi:VWFA-related protein